MTLPDTAVLSLFDRNGNAKDVYVPLTSRYTWEQSFNCSSFLEDVKKLDIVKGNSVHMLHLKTMVGLKHKGDQPYMEADDYCEHYMEVFALVDWDANETDTNPACGDIEGPFLLGARVVYLDMDDKIEAYLDMASLMEKDTQMDFLQKWASLMQARRVSKREFLGPDDDEDDDDDLSLYKELKIYSWTQCCKYLDGCSTEREAFDRKWVDDEVFERALDIVYAARKSNVVE
jgi:hypothetical protein